MRVKLSAQINFALIDDTAAAATAAATATATAAAACTAGNVVKCYL
ncbi:unnamed protein product [Brugia pahangi]|uniref:Uncharacterized protein n=1 Tax=Brugia pahangi TaxID=6280 RepID=A0A0N4TY66_BRUPA|nr:unnamed protein product [Brugia pahangi]